jgi:hypothetical protein
MGNSHEVITSHCHIIFKMSVWRFLYNLMDIASAGVFFLSYSLSNISLYAHMCLLSETVSGVSFRYLISHCSSFDSHKQISNLSPYHSLLLYQSSPLQLLVAEVKNLCSYRDHIVTERSK